MTNDVGFSVLRKPGPRNGARLVYLNECVDWEFFRPELETPFGKSPAGRTPVDALLAFNAMMLQSLYHPSDDTVEERVRDRLSFFPCLFLTIGDRVPQVTVKSCGAWDWRIVCSKGRIHSAKVEKHLDELRVPFGRSIG